MTYSALQIIKEAQTTSWIYFAQEYRLASEGSIQDEMDEDTMSAKRNQVNTVLDNVFPSRRSCALWKMDLTWIWKWLKN